MKFSPIRKNFFQGGGYSEGQSTLTSVPLKKAGMTCIIIIKDYWNKLYVGQRFHCNNKEGKRGNVNSEEPGQMFVSDKSTANEQYKLKL
jgi:hypothetical protein